MIFKEFKDASGTITSGGNAQTALAASDAARRQYIYIQNVSDTDMWFNTNGTTAVASQPSFLVKANGSSWESPPNFCPQGAVSVIGATTGKGFIIKYVE